ncbi:hypothetical protein [Endozoicomonas ascidiicola]|uniref:hypothetical protein n=1 Tax=Endozoicomonas ascidiicola TaxID=1698521 RepID=UPI000AE11497|nr:hypothetical protein [Endozoicomonas ascidiicola]
MLSISPVKFPEDAHFLTKWMTLGLLLTIVSSFIPLSSKFGNNIFYLLVLLPFLISLTTGERANYRLGTLTPWFIGLIALMSVFAFHTEPLKAIKYAIYLICFWSVISSLVARQIINTDKLALWLMVISVSFSLLLLFIHFVINAEPLSIRPNFWESFRFGNPIHVCMLLVCFSVIGIMALPNRLRPVLGGIIILLILVIQSLFQTRSGIAGLLGAGLFLILVIATNKGSIGKSGFIAAAVVVIGGVLINHMNLFDVMMARGESHRLELYKIAWSEYQNCNWLTGCGYGYEFISTLKGGAPVVHPHSIYSSLLVYLGPLSLIALLALQLRAFIANWKIMSPWFYGVAASSAFFMLDGKNILDNLNITWICLILPLAIIDGQTRLKKTEK